MSEMVVLVAECPSWIKKEKFYPFSISYNVLREDLILKWLEEYDPSSDNIQLKAFTKKSFHEWSLGRANLLAKALKIKRSEECKNKSLT